MLTSPRRRVRGVGLIDALIALAILAFGLIGMTRLQTNVMRQATETQHRMAATRLADELLSTALVDNTNVDCYTVPATGACANANARTATDAWETRAVQTLPGRAGTPPTASAVAAGGRLTVTLTWTGRTEQDDRRLEMTTDVR